jgi:GGDEF domain-containing protein
MSPDDVAALLRGLEASAAPVALFDPQGRRVFANPAFEASPAGVDAPFDDGWRLVWGAMPDARSPAGGSDPVYAEAEQALRQSQARKRAFAIALISLDAPAPAVGALAAAGAGGLTSHAFTTHCARSLRPGDQLMPLDSGEFMLQLPGAGLHMAASVVHRLRQSLRWSQAASGTKAPSRGGFCAGIAEARPDDGWTALLSRTRRALTTAKQRGPDNSVLAAPTD